MNYGALMINGGFAIWVFVTMVWMYSLVKNDSGIMDIFWGIGFIIAGYFYISADYSTSIQPRLLFLLVLIWGFRLALHIGIRNTGRPEDARYAAWRTASGKKWWWFSYLKVFLLQGVVMWIVSLPLLTGLQDQSGLGLLDYAGILFWITGMYFETVGDWQLLQFKKKAENKGKVFKDGLWAYTRHPNYFGESLIWWGFTLIAIQGTTLWILVSPILMTFLLLKVSGVNMLDKLLSRTKPEYADYIRNTNAFIPGRKK